MLRVLPYLYLLFLLVGCDRRQEMQAGSVTVTKVDGQVVSVDVVFPHLQVGGQNNFGPISLTDRNQIEALLKNLDAMQTDLKAAQADMAVIEPPVQQQSKK